MLLLTAYNTLCCFRCTPCSKRHGFWPRHPGTRSFGRPGSSFNCRCHTWLTSVRVHAATPSLQGRARAIGAASSGARRQLFRKWKLAHIVRVPETTLRRQIDRDSHYNEGASTIERADKLTPKLSHASLPLALVTAPLVFAL